MGKESAAQRRQCYEWGWRGGRWDPGGSGHLLTAVMPGERGHAPGWLRGCRGCVPVLTNAAALRGHGAIPGPFKTETLSSSLERAQGPGHSTPGSDWHRVFRCRKLWGSWAALPLSSRLRDGVKCCSLRVWSISEPT